jgi:hypothetical protein
MRTTSSQLGFGDWPCTYHLPWHGIWHGRTRNGKQLGDETRKDSDPCDNSRRENGAWGMGKSKRTSESESINSLHCPAQLLAFCSRSHTRPYYPISPTSVPALHLLGTQLVSLVGLHITSPLPVIICAVHVDYSTTPVLLHKHPSPTEGEAGHMLVCLTRTPVCHLDGTSIRP